MKVQVDIQRASAQPAPGKEDIRRWLAAALQGSGRERSEISLRIVDVEEMTALNRRYRGKYGPTNVLSFPADLPAELSLPLLGDIVICAPVVRAEAREQGKDLTAHWAHMVIHGTLHLLGYDHTAAEQALAMETLETAIMATLDFPAPYADQSSTERVHA